MKHVFLVTSKYNDEMFGDSMFIEGVFKTKKSAHEYVDNAIDKDVFDYTITKHPFGDHRPNDPNAFYYEE